MFFIRIGGKQVEHRFIGLCGTFFLYLLPVSYTHLDVYKRQMLPDEVCELIKLDPAEIEKQRLSGRLRFAEEENGTRHYSIVDIINLKDSIDWKVINRQVESLSFEEEE